MLRIDIDAFVDVCYSIVVEFVQLLKIEVMDMSIQLLSLISISFGSGTNGILRDQFERKVTAPFKSLLVDLLGYFPVSVKVVASGDLSGLDGGLASLFLNEFDDFIEVVLPWAVVTILPDAPGFHLPWELASDSQRELHHVPSNHMLHLVLEFLWVWIQILAIVVNMFSESFRCLFLSL